MSNRYISPNRHVYAVNKRQVIAHMFGMAWMFLLALPTHAALPDTSACPCPNRDDPVAVLTCYLDKPIDDSMRGIGNCLAKAEDGYPGKPSYDYSRPNIYRSYRILSVVDGKPYRGQVTKQIKMEFDYVAQIDEKSPDGIPLCKIWQQTVTAYQTKTGWVIDHPFGWIMSFKLNPLLISNYSFLEKRYGQGDIYSVKQMSAEILSLESATKHCPKPVEGDWQ